MNPTPELTASTYDRLLEAAGEVFAEVGYHEATVRSICQRAQANIAAIHYHFGDKERLYTAVLQFGARKVLERFPPDRGLGPSSTPEERLFAYVRSFISRFLDPAGPDWYGKLCAREMMEPTQALDALVRDIIRPLAERLHVIVRDLSQHSLAEEQVRLCSMSVIGQCLFYHHNRPAIERLYGTELYAGASIELISRHVTDFSLNALKGFIHRS
jgi:AcrR family transcriptional regulator